MTNPRPRKTKSMARPQDVGSALVIPAEINPSGGKIRMAGTHDHPLFHAMDAATVLEYANQRDAILKHVEPDDVAFHDVIDSMGRTQKNKFLTENGFYDLVFGSKLPNAKAFKRWVTGEVLPCIRKYGCYPAPVVQQTIWDETGWQPARAEGKVARREECQAIAATVGGGYGHLTNGTYLGLTGKTADVIRQELGLSKSATIRDHLPKRMLRVLSFVEEATAARITERGIKDQDAAFQICVAIGQETAAILPVAITQARYQEVTA